MCWLLCILFPSCCFGTGRMKKISILLIVFIAAIAIALLIPEATIQPGGLSSEHQYFNNDCLKCHTMLKGAVSDKCMNCHSPDQTSAITTFHRYLEESDCMACHALHADKRSQQPAQSFQHGLLPDSFLEDNCVSCHQESIPSDNLHQSTGGNCGFCHSTKTWFDVSYAHDQFKLDRKHTSICSSCHTTAKDYSQYTCYGCHEHNASKIRGKHIEEGILNYENCVSCHRSGSERSD